MEKYPKSSDIFFLNGIINLSLNNYLQSIDSFNQAISLNKKNLDAYNNKGVAFFHLGNFISAKDNFEEGLKIKPNDPLFLNNIGTCLDSLKKFDDAIWYYNESIKFNNNFSLPIFNTIKILRNFHMKEDSNQYVTTNNKIRSLNFKINIDEIITDETIISFLNQYIKLIPDEVLKFDFKDDQIFRRDKSLNCGRHFEIFKKFNTIPEFCFGCYKVQIQPKNLLDLIKLYLIFDKIKLPENNIRKCAIETRKKVAGAYKGFIYCSGIDEAKKLFNLMSSLLKNTIDKKINIKIKRGCTEFSEAHPNYSELDSSSKNFMYYNKKWKSNEIIIDKNENLKKKIFHPTLNGVTLSDILIIKNWIIYAKYIGDSSYQNLDKINFNSDYINRQILKQLDKRKEEFLKVNSNV